MQKKYAYTSGWDGQVHPANLLGLPGLPFLSPFNFAHKIAIFDEAVSGLILPFSQRDLQLRNPRLQS